MQTRFMLCLFLVFSSFQCDAGELQKIRKELEKTSCVKFLNKKEFEKSRSLMLEKLPSNLLENDTIVFMEYFSDGVGVGYYCTIYKSSDKSVERYIAKRSIKENKVCVDSLIVLDVPDKILEMVHVGKLDEIKKKGDTTTLTPSATLIINIGVKDKKQMKFNFTTLVTQNFSISEK